MKKLIVMAAVVCAAVAAQAARITWSASAVKDSSSKGWASGEVNVYYKLETAQTWTKATNSYHPNMTEGSFSWQSSINLANGSKFEAYYTINEDDPTSFKSATTQFTPTGSGAAARYTVDLGNSGTWGDPEPTPEPTSAMLMLLGVAGLALKRKRA